MALSLPDPAASAAVLIGSSTFRDARLAALPGVANNVADLAAILTDAELLGSAGPAYLHVARLC